MYKLIAHNPSYGNCIGIEKSLSLKGEVQSFFKRKDKKGMFDKSKHKKGYHQAACFSSKKTYIVGSVALLSLYSKYATLFHGKTEVTVILTDTFYIQNKKQINKIIKNMTIFCMSDLSPFCKHPHKLFYHPMELPLPKKKNDRLTICHSPFSESKRNTKGTAVIEEVIEKIQLGWNVAYDCIEGESWETSIKRKGKAHFFIDQVITKDEYGWAGGLGKSGIEAMLLKCLTFTSGEQHLSNDQIPECPVVWVTPETLEETLRYYIADDEKRRDKIEEQYIWAKTYLNYEFQSEYLT